MNYIVLDLEWNQSGYKHETNSNNKKTLQFEIIEIGAVKLNDKLEEIDRFQCYIKPQVYKKLNSMTKKIVNVTNENLETGSYFASACMRFLKWCGKDYIFCTWGVSDISELQKNMDYYRMRPLNDGPITYYDIQKFYRLLFNEGKQIRTLQHAIETLNLPENLEFHGALNDALYTAQVMRSIDFDGIRNYYSIDCYRLPKSKEDEIEVTFDTYSKYISCGHESREELMDDGKIKSMVCYKCGRKCRKKVHWFSSSGKNYHGLGICKEHGLLKGKIRIRQNATGLYYVVKTLKLVDDEGAMEVYEKKEIAVKKKLKRKNKILGNI